MTRVALCDVREADLPVLFEHQLDPDAVAMADFPSRDRAAFDAHWKKILADPTCITKAILADGELAGYIGCWGDDERFVGYWLGREFWGRGIATKALSLFLEAMTRRPLTALVSPHNTGSIRVLEKCGFTLVREDHNERVMILT